MTERSGGGGEPGATPADPALDATRPHEGPAQTVTDPHARFSPPPRPAARRGDELVGRTLGDFIVRERIGEGGYGAVYRAFQPLLGREAVVKVLHTALRRDEHATQRFLREARLASRLDHPYAAHLYAFGVEPDGLSWIAMELVDGVALDAFLADHGPLPLEAAISFLECLCEVVHTAHERGIIHRDLKPSNVMVLSRAGRMLPKLLDLGIAKAVAMPLALDPPGSEQAAAESSGDRTVTQRGAAMGSPPYMAPEQWRDASEVDARTDVYALGVLAYEVLTGRRPFTGPSAMALMNAHLGDPPPLLGEGLPGALDGAIARALAKAPQDRHASPLALAAALRAAGGLLPEPIPSLPAPVRDAWVHGAPQPLAEAVAALDAARSLREARDALGDLVGTVVRYLGVIVLAGRAAIDAAIPDEASRSLIRDLRRRRYGNEDWWALCEALARGLDPRAFPVPELVGLLADDSPLRALVARPPGGQRQRDPQIREALIAAVEQAAALLERLELVFRYPLVVVRDDRLELWMGIRRPRRAAIPRTVALPAGTPGLVTADGRLVVSLEPLAEIAPPAPGAPEELFLLDGRGTRDAARLVALPAGFEHNRDGLWPWFARHLLDDLAPPAEVAPDEAPYPGLAAFARGDATRFFGREREADAFLNRLRVQSLIAVVGASGAGKSSFVQAGVLPQLPEGWRAITIRPGPEPLASLEAMLRQLGVARDLERELEADPERLGRCLRQLGDAHAAVVVVVDQLEELFTLCRDASRRALFADALVRAARTPADPVRVILTLRDDFLVRAEELPSLRERLTWGLQVLATPARADLLRIVVEPARRAGYAFEDPALPARMVDAVAGQPGALALLSFTGAALWRERDRTTRQLTRGAYDALGGVGGALAAHAEGVLDGMIREERELVRETFRHLITADGTRGVIARRDLCTILEHARAEAVLERLIDARLLVASEGLDAPDRIEIIHEALLEAWPRLRGWVHDDREGARLRDQLRSAAQQWHDRNRPSGLLWRGDALGEYRRWRSRHAGALSEVEEAFVRASLADAARGRRIRGFAIASVLGVLSIAVVILLRLRGTAETERARAELLARRSHQELVAQLEAQGREALLAGDVVRAAEHLVHAHDEGLRGDGLAIMLHRVVASRAAALRTFAVGAPVRWAELSADGARLLTVRDGDGRVSVWDVATGAERAREAGIGDAPRAHFDATGERVVIAGAAPKLWDLRGGGSVVLPRKADPVDVIRFGPRDTVITRSNSEVVLWDAATGKRLRQLAVAKPWTTRLDVSGDLIAATDDRTVAIWDASGRLVRRYEGHTDEILRVVFSADRATLATASADGTARLWDLRASSAPVVMNHGGRIADVRFEPSGKHLLTVSESGSARLWDVRGQMTSSFAERRGKLTSCDVDPLGRYVSIAGADGIACLHEIPTGDVLQCLEGHTKPIMATRLGPDGRTVLTASADGTARLWRADLRQFAASFPHADRVSWIAFAPDGATVVTTDWTGVVRSWNIATGQPRWVARRPHDEGIVTSLTVTASRILTTGHDARLWDARTGELLTVMTSAAGAYTDGKLIDDRIVLASEQGAIEIRTLAGAPERTIRAHRGSIAQLAASADGRRIVSAGDDGGAIFDVRTGERLGTLTGHEGPLTDVAISPDGGSIVTVGIDRTIRIWDRAGRPQRILRSTSGLRFPRFDRHGRLLTAHEDGAIYVWDPTTGAIVTRLRGHSTNVWSLHVAANDDLAVSSSKDGETIVWDLERLGGVARFKTNDAPIMATAIGPRGVVATGSWDHTAKIWRFAPGELAAAVARARQMVR